eukprot:476668-Prymnesium_polylepis.2
MTFGSVSDPVLFSPRISGFGWGVEWRGRRAHGHAGGGCGHDHSWSAARPWRMGPGVERKPKREPGVSRTRYRFKFNGSSHPARQGSQRTETTVYTSSNSQSTKASSAASDHARLKDLKQCTTWTPPASSSSHQSDGRALPSCAGSLPAARQRPPSRHARDRL